MTLHIALALEFLPAEEVVAAKTVSKGFRRAARHALCRGRWKPVAQSIERMNALHEARRCGPNGETPKPVVASDLDSAHTVWRAAWAIDPALAAAEMISHFDANMASEFFVVVEPEIEGLRRLCASMERIDPENFRYAFWSWVEAREAGLAALAEADPPTLRRGEIDTEPYWKAFWRAIEVWSDGTRIGEVLTGAFCDDLECDYSEHYVDEMTEDWEDKEKRAAVWAVFEPIYDDLEEQFQADWQAEHGWKYCPHGSKHWDCPHCSEEWNAGFESA